MPIHVKATKSDVAKYVLLPGNPERAEYIATKFLDNPKKYTDYRLMYGYTGTYKGIEVSVQTTGMGCPSAGIITEELIMLGAKVFLRVGTCGAIHPSLELSDLIVSTSACSMNSSTKDLVGFEGYPPTASFDLVKYPTEIAGKEGIKAKTGIIASQDLFYDPRENLAGKLAKFGVLALEMEASMIFSIAARENLKAGCLLTVSDIIATNTRAEPEVIQHGVDKMIKVALESFYAMENE